MNDPVQQWAEVIRQRPELYRLPHYGPYLTPERIAEYFAAWYAAEAAGEPIPAHFRRCGRLLRESFRPHQQLHLACEPPLPKDLS